MTLTSFGDSLASPLTSNDSQVQVHVHRYGESAPDVDNPVMYSISMMASRQEVLCGSRMVLDVSEHGIIGRGLSIRNGEGAILGSGVIGWNA